MSRRYGERIAGYIERSFDEIPSNRFSIFDMQAEAAHHTRKISDGYDFNLTFNILNLQVSYILESLHVIEDLPKIDPGDSRVQRRAKELEYQRLYRSGEKDPSTGKPYATTLELFPSSNRKEGRLLSAADPTIYYLGQRGYLPLDIPYLTPDGSITVDERYYLMGQFKGVTDQSADRNIISFDCYYVGEMNFSLRDEIQSHSHVFPKSED